MASIIKIKRSTGSTPPAQLGSGELAYAWDESGGFQNGKLFLGTGTETAGAAANIETIGGKYFTNLLDHAAGIVVASSALLVDSNKKLNELLVDNITLDGNTVATTDLNGNLVLAPNGTGLVSIAGAYTLPRVGGTSGQVLTTNGTSATWQSPSASSFTLAGNTGTDTFNTGETLSVLGTGGISTAVTNNTYTISLAASGVTAGTYTKVTVAADGRVTAGASLLAADVPTLNQNTTGSAASLTTARTIAISGPITGTATSFNGTANITIPVTALDVSHVNVTGTLPVARGGTGVTTSTGTGSVVLSDSPALSGTPTAPTAAAGTNTTQVATTQFVRTEVDNARVGIDAKDSVRVATTANITLSNTQTVDGIALAVGDRILVKNQTTATENGIYLVASGAWTRTSDAVTGTLTSGAFVFVETGTTNSDSGWVLSTPGIITVGTTALVWVQFSGAGQIIAGAGLTKTGNTLDVGAGTGIVVAADTVGLTGQALAVHNLATNGLIARTGTGAVAARSVAGTTNRITLTNGDGVSGNPTVDIASTYVGQTSITTLGTITTGTWNGTAIAVTNGGTGATSLTARGVVFGNGTSAVGVTGTSAIDGSFLREDATGNPYWSNVVDGGTY